MDWREQERAARRARYHEHDLAKTLRIYEQLLQRTDVPDDHRRQMTNTYADLLRRTDRYEESLQWAQRLVAEDRVHEPSRLGNDLMFMSQVLKVLGRVAEARAAVAEALPLYVEEFGPDHREVGFIRSEFEHLERQSG
jgi:hypothetical protein